LRNEQRPAPAIGGRGGPNFPNTATAIQEPIWLFDASIEVSILVCHSFDADGPLEPAGINSEPARAEDGAATAVLPHNCADLLFDALPDLKGAVRASTFAQVDP